MPCGEARLIIRDANRARVREAGAAIRAETGGPPTIGELKDRTGLARQTVIRHRQALLDDGDWPFGVLGWGGRRRPRPADPVLDVIDVKNVWARARKLRESKGHAPDPRGIFV